MAHLTGDDILHIFLALGVILVAARVLGEVARRFSQPAVLGEIAAGVLLGPTLFGSLAPGAAGFLLPSGGSSALVLGGMGQLAMALFLLVAGMEVELSSILRRSGAVMWVSVLGILLPFAAGFAAANYAPDLLGAGQDSNREHLALFFATALSISALPVIAKTLMDLHIYKSDFGMTVIGAAVIGDLVGWMTFAVILGQVENAPTHPLGIGWTLAMASVFAVGMLTLVRWLIHRTMPFILAHTNFPTGVIGFALALALFGAAFTQYIGIHAIFGAFLVGVALGDSAHLRERTRATITEFVHSLFAPLFFGSIGLSVNFIEHFDPLLCGFVLVVACVGKILGCGLGARLAKLPWNEAWAVGFAMNARGAMEIILGTLALQYGVIGEPMFVALVVMALATSMMSGPVMQRLLGRERPRRLEDFLTSRTFLLRVKATERKAAIDELCLMLSQSAGLDYEKISSAVWEREMATPTGIGNALAVPHARVDGLKRPVVALGLSEHGVDFDADDGQPAQAIFVILTPPDDSGVQLEILANISRAFATKDARERLLRARGYTELLALLRTEPARAA